MKKINLFLLLSIFIASVNGQDILSVQLAVEKTLENNFGVLVSNNNIEIANNNSGILNTKFLPTLTANGGANYNLNNITANRQDGTSATLNGANSSSYNAALNLNYTLFDGLGRWYNYKQLKEKYELSELDARITIENAIVQTLNAYYNVAVQQLNKSVYEEALQVSANRLQRATNAFNFGQGNKLAILNAQVDLNNDSISLANANLALQNAKRNLNAIMVQNVDFEIDSALNFVLGADKEQLKKAMLANNASIIQAKKNIEIGNYNIHINKARYLPNVAATAQYGWNRSNNNAASFLASSVSYGLSTGATISWNLFDGGTTKVNLQNTSLQLDNLALQLAQLTTNLDRDFENAWAEYQNKLYVYKTQSSNLISNKDNFERTNEKFKLGQVSSVEYRQAQLNLLMAATQVTQAKYSAKLAEISLLQLSGTLLETSF